MAEKEINPISFADERSAEIQLIETAIESNRKKSMMFQRLPFYLRRRSKSHEKRKKRRRNPRKKDRHGLRTHTWYAKRFEMLKTWNTSIPMKRRMKSSKFIYKSQHRGFIFDESYKKIVVYARPWKEMLGIDFSLENVVQEIRLEDSMFEAVVTTDYLVIISQRIEDIEEKMDPSLVEHYRPECCLSVMKADLLFSDELSERTVKFSKFLVSKRSADVNKALRERSDEIIYFRSVSENESGKVLLSRGRVLDFWQSILNVGIIPICVEELQRLALENDYIAYPFDYPNTRAYKAFEEAYIEPIKAKYDRTPRSKKMSFDTSTLYIHTERHVVLAGFELEKGSSDRGAFVFDEDKVVGRVVRSAFCFSKGLCKGLCYLYQAVEEGEEFYARNLNSASFNQIKITKIFGE